MSLRPCRRLLAALLLCAAAPAGAAELRHYQYHQSFISACRADPRTDVIRTYWKDGAGQPLGTFVRLDAMLREQGEQMLCATNGGIYDKQLQPLGLYIEDGKLLRRLNIRQNAYGNFYLQPNGVFVLTRDRAFIVETGAYALQSSQWSAEARYATQSGPVMIAQGQINSLFDPNSPNLAIRNAVCIDSADMVVLAIARNPISFYDFAVFLRDQLKCRDALYLDGSISRMYPTLEANLGPAFGSMITVLKQATKKSPQ